MKNHISAEEAELMIMDMPIKEPELEKPGSGLPIWEERFLRYIGMPIVTRIMSWPMALRFFEKEGQKILCICDGLTAEELCQQVLVKRESGMEDSSRYWSVAMTLQHLTIVGNFIMPLVKQISEGQQDPVVVDIAQVKPEKITNTIIVDEFRNMMENFIEAMNHESINRKSKTTQFHPWVGNMTAHEWVCLAGIHNQIHRKQIKQIVNKLRG